MKHDVLHCPYCLKLLDELARKDEQLKAAKAQLKKQQRQIDEGYFGSSTPSSKKPPQPNTNYDGKNKGGAKQGHIGSGRSSHNATDADITIELNVEAESCPDCGGELTDAFTKDRSVVDIDPAQMRKILLYLKSKKCRSCKKIFSPKSNKVLPKFL